MKCCVWNSCLTRIDPYSSPDQELLLEGARISVDDLRCVTRWHGRVVNPKLARARAGQLVAALQARHKKIAKEAQAAKARKNQSTSLMYTNMRITLMALEANTLLSLQR